jgi:hypothetical protein
VNFKLWLKLMEDLAGAGGGPNPQPDDQVSLNKNIASHGAGAFQTIGGDPPKSPRTPTKNYEDRRSFRKSMKKN